MFFSRPSSSIPSPARKRPRAEAEEAPGDEDVPRTIRAGGLGAWGAWGPSQFVESYSNLRSFGVFCSDSQLENPPAGECATGPGNGCRPDRVSARSCQLYPLPVANNTPTHTRTYTEELAPELELTRNQPEPPRTTPERNQILPPSPYLVSDT